MIVHWLHWNVRMEGWGVLCVCPSVGLVVVSCVWCCAPLHGLPATLSECRGES